jgi:hypothetical protein
MRRRAGFKTAMIKDKFTLVNPGLSLVVIRLAAGRLRGAGEGMASGSTAAAIRARPERHRSNAAGASPAWWAKRQPPVALGHALDFGANRFTQDISCRPLPTSRPVGCQTTHRSPALNRRPTAGCHLRPRQIGGDGVGEDRHCRGRVADPDRLAARVNPDR